MKGKFTQPSKSLIYYEHDCTLRGSRISGGSIWPSPMENSRTNELLGNRVKIKCLLHCQQELTIANLSFYRGKRMHIFPKTLFVIDPTWIKSFETFSPLFFHIFLMNLEVFSWNKFFQVWPFHDGFSWNLRLPVCLKYPWKIFQKSIFFYRFCWTFLLKISIKVI